MFVTCRALNWSHQDTAVCIRGGERKLKQLREEEERMVMAVTFQAYRGPLQMVSAFKYLGRVLTASDDDCPTMVTNIWGSCKDGGHIFQGC